MCISSCSQQQIYDKNQGKCVEFCQISQYNQYQDSISLSCEQSPECPLLQYFGQEYPTKEIPVDFILQEDKQFLAMIGLQTLYVIDIQSGKQITEEYFEKAIKTFEYLEEREEIILLDVAKQIHRFSISTYQMQSQNQSNMISHLRIKTNSNIFPHLNYTLLFGVEEDAYLYNYEADQIKIIIPLSSPNESVEAQSSSNQPDNIHFLYWIQNRILQIIQLKDLQQNQQQIDILFKYDFTNQIPSTLKNDLLNSYFMPLQKQILIQFENFSFQYNTLNNSIQSIDTAGCVDNILTAQKMLVSNNSFLIYNSNNSICFYTFESIAYKWQYLFEIIQFSGNPHQYVEMNNNSKDKDYLILDEQGIVYIYSMSIIEKSYKLMFSTNILQTKTTQIIKSLMNQNIYYFLGSDCTIVNLQKIEPPNSSSDFSFKYNVQNKFMSYQQEQKYNLTQQYTKLVLNQYERIYIHFDSQEQETQFHLFDGVTKKYLRSFKLGVDYSDPSPLMYFLQYPQFIVGVFSSGFHLIVNTQTLLVVQQIQHLFNPDYLDTDVFSGSTEMKNPPSNLNYLITYSFYNIQVFKYDQSQPKLLFALDSSHKTEYQVGKIIVNLFNIYITETQGVSIFLLDYSQNFLQLHSYNDQNIKGNLLFFDINEQFQRVILTLYDTTVWFFDFNLTLLRTYTIGKEVFRFVWIVRENLSIGQSVVKDFQDIWYYYGQTTFWDTTLNKFQNSYQTYNTELLYYIPQQKVLFGTDQCWNQLNSFQNNNLVSQIFRYCSYSEFYQINFDDWDDNQFLYTSQWDSTAPYEMFYDEQNDEILVGNWHGNAQINQNFKNFYKEILFQGDEQIETVLVVQQLALLIIKTNQQLFIQNMMNWQHVYQYSKDTLIQICQSDLYDWMLAGFTSTMEVILWDLKKNTFQNYIPKTQTNLSQIFFFKDKIIITDQSGHYLLCLYNEDQSLFVCKENVGSNTSNIIALKIDSEYSIIFSLSNKELIIQRISDDISEISVVSKIQVNNSYDFLIDEFYQRIYTKSAYFFDAYDFEGYKIKTLQSFFEYDTMQDGLLGETIIIGYSPYSYSVIDRQSLQFLNIDNTDGQILQIIIMEEINLIAYITDQKNVGSIHLFNFKTFSTVRSKLQPMASRAALLTTKMVYDSELQQLVTSNEQGDIVIWGFNPSVKHTFYMQYLTNKNHRQNAPMLDMIIDEVNNSLISYDKKTIVMWEYSHYITKGGEYQALPKDQNIPFIYDNQNNNLLIVDEKQNIFQFSNNKYQYLKEMTSDLKGIYDLKGLPGQGNNKFYFAYDFYQSFILNSNFEVIWTEESSLILLCIQINDTRGLQNQFIVSSRMDNSINLKTILQLNNQYTIKSDFLFNFQTRIVQLTLFEKQNIFVSSDRLGNLKIVSVITPTNILHECSSQYTKGEIRRVAYNSFDNTITYLSKYYFAETKIDYSSGSVQMKPSFSISPLQNNRFDIVRVDYTTYFLYLKYWEDKVLYIYNLSLFKQSTSIQSASQLIDVNSKALVKIIPLFSVYNIQLAFFDNLMYIYSAFQIKAFDRKTHQFIASRRNPAESKFINQIIPFDNQQMIVLTKFFIGIYAIRNDKIVVTTKFNLIKPRLFSNTYILGELNLVGSSQDRIFNYTVSLQQNNKICSHRFQPVARTAMLVQEINKLGFSSQELNFGIQSYQFQVPTLGVQTKLPYMNHFQLYFSKQEIEYTTDSGILSLKENSFNHLEQSKLLLNQYSVKFEMDIANSQQRVLDSVSSIMLEIKFNPHITEVHFSNLIFGQGQIENVSILFQNMDFVQMQNIIIKEIGLMDNVILFQFINCTKIVIDTLIIQNISQISSSVSFLYFYNVEQLQITNLIIENVNHKVASTDFGTMQLLVMKLIQNLSISNCTFINITSSGQFDSSIIDGHGINKFNFTNITISNLVTVTLLRYESTYVYNDIQYSYLNDQININTLACTNINLQKSSFITFTFNFITILNVNTNTITCLSCNGAFLSVVYPTDSFIISQSTFQSCQANIGGVIFLTLNKGDQYGTVSINNSKFISNIAKQYGGAIFIEFSDLILKQTQFIKNKASIGGAIRYMNFKPQFSFKQNNQNNQLDLLFQDNVADIYGQDYTSVPFYLNTIFPAPDLTQNQNDEYVVQQVSSYPSINKFRSGGTISFYVQLLDENYEVINLMNKIDLFQFFKKQNVSKSSKNIIEEFDTYLLQLMTNTTSISLDNNLIITLKNLQIDQNKLLFNNVIVIGIPLSQNNFYIQAPFLSSTNQQNQIIKVLKEYPINVSFRNCKEGEYYSQPSNSKIKCNICLNNTYSLVQYPVDQIAFQNIQCKTCPETANRCYSNIIELKQGYWRKDNSSDIIIRCENEPDNCIEYKNGTYCKEGYIGPLCEQCDTSGEFWGNKFSKLNDYVCERCSTNNTFLKQIAIFICILVYIVFALIFFQNMYQQMAIIYYLRMLSLISLGNSSLQNRSSIFVKQLIHYFQISQIINTLNIKIPVEVLIIPRIFGRPIEAMNVATDCIFSKKNGMPQIYVRVILSIILPIIYCLVIYVILWTIQKLTKKNSKSQYFKMIIVFSIIFFQPNVSSFLISTMSCRQIGDIKYIIADINLVCYTSDHISYIICLIIPSLLLWSFSPLFFLKSLKDKKNQLHYITTQYNYGFLYLEYKHKHYYWEFFRSYMKLLIFFFHNIFLYNPSNQNIYLFNLLFENQFLKRNMNQLKEKKENFQLDKQIKE